MAAEARHAGMRLDRVAAQLIPEISRSRLKALLAEGQVRVNGRPEDDPNARLRPGDRIEVTLPAPVAGDLRPEAIALDILYEDASLIVIDKPAGMVVHPAAGNWSGTLVNALLAHCGESLAQVGGTGRPGIVHRIDKETSGLLVAAKTEQAHRSLGRQFAAHAITRVYTCIAWGAPKAQSLTITGNIARSAADRKRMTIVREGGKEATTHVELLECFALGRSARVSLLACRLETGRTHQIRVHLSHKGLPLVGDPVYGHAPRLPPARTKEEAAAQAALSAFPRQALHAGVLGFQHPVSHKPMRFESVLPADLAHLLKLLQKLDKSAGI